MQEKSCKGVSLNAALRFDNDAPSFVAASITDLYTAEFTNHEVTSLFYLMFVDVIICLSAHVIHPCKTPDADGADAAA